MFEYTFPHISHLSQVLVAIKDRPEFFVKECDRHTIVNYHVVGNDTFPPVIDTEGYNFNHAVLRECRGIVFGDDGGIIARRYHKFFNVNEREEVGYDRIDLRQPHDILEKLDGSMITPIPIGDHIRWGTKMGLTSVGFQAEKYVSVRENYLRLAENCRDAFLTPMFEWCSRKQKIVVDYPQDQLVLTAIRHNITGQYHNRSVLEDVGDAYSVPVVKYLHHHDDEDHFYSARSFVETKAMEEDGEGYVIRFTNGHMLKAKNEWYTTIHRAKDGLSQEKRVIEMIVEQRVDDVLPFLVGHEKEALATFVNDYVKGYNETRDNLIALRAHVKDQCENSKKRFAIEVSKDLPHGIRSCIFATWDDGDDYELIDDWIQTSLKKHLGSQTLIDQVRWIWGNKTWYSYYTKEDENSA